jgi:isopentenyl diphosphate isomerase/L-lactate dehydrogenase-like FMN-dependent dehydrogenase
MAVSGEAGVRRALEILRTDADRLLGCASIAALDRSYVSAPPNW